MSEILHFDDGPITNEVTSRQVTIAIIPHITGLCSVLGSLFITVDIFRDRKKHTSVFHRIMLGMSLSDLVASLFLFLSTWPVPSDSEGIHGAVGNLQTCQVQGFFIQLGVGTFFYTAYLAVYYLCMVRYHWKERDFVRVEKWAHAVALLITLGTSIASLFLQLYNNANLWCWIAPYPLDCLNSSKNGGVTTCIRGDNAYIYRIAFYFIWMWLAVITVAVCMGLVVYTVYKQRKTMEKWNPTNAVKRTSMSRQRDSILQAVATQACLYIGAFLLTAIFPSLVRMFQAKWNCTSTFYPLTIMTVTFFPLQGLWNAFVYVRPRFQKAARDHSSWSQYQVVSYTIGRTLGCSWGMASGDDQDYKLGTGTAYITTPVAVHGGTDNSSTTQHLSGSLAVPSKAVSSSATTSPRQEFDDLGDASSPSSTHGLEEEEEDEEPSISSPSSLASKARRIHEKKFHSSQNLWLEQAEAENNEDS